jgi:dTDP-4-amino-4,6-dideoxygalactose transaminase
MKKLPWRVERKKRIYELYANELRGAPGLEMVPVTPENVLWFVDVYVSDPAGVLDRLKARGIGARRVYPPISRQKIYPTAATFPVSESYSARGLWLPSSSFLDDATIKRICAELRACLSPI